MKTSNIPTNMGPMYITFKKSPDSEEKDVLVYFDPENAVVYVDNHIGYWTMQQFHRCLDDIIAYVPIAIMFDEQISDQKKECSCDFHGANCWQGCTCGAFKQTKEEK